MISIIIPFHNEEENLSPLIDQIGREMGKRTYEIVCIDDGSTDKSRSVMTRLADKNERIIFLSHRTQMGKGAALKNGIAKAKGDVIVFMDADLQDDPADISKFLEKIDNGYELVNGWRKDRHDGIIKTIPSKIGNVLILRYVLQSKFHDINCGYKAMRRDVLDQVHLYGDHFRFIPLIAERKGFKTTEVVVAHHGRAHGKSKYGFFRRFTIFADILTSYFIFRFAEKPLHFFGSIGGLLFGAGFAVATYLSYERLFHGILLYRRPALLFALSLIIVGIQVILTGIVAELVVYLSEKSKTRKS